MAPRRVLVGVPAVPASPYRPPLKPVYGRVWTHAPRTVPVNEPAPRRSKRAAVDDLWRGCQRGLYCPTDIKNRYTHNTVADQILKYGSAGVFLGGLTIGTGSGAAGGDVLGAAAAAGEAGEAAAGARPFNVPSGDVPVRVDVDVPAPGPPEIPGNTFLNPVFDGSIISGSSSDSVLVGDPQPMPDAYRPLELGPLYYPAREPPPFPEVEVPTRRGDSLDVVGEATPRRSFPGAPEVPPRTGPFEEIELVPLDGQDPFRVPEVEYDVWVGGAVEEVPVTSTPGPGPRTTEVTFENPVFDSAHIDELFRRGLRDIGVGEDEILELWPDRARVQGRQVQVQRSGVSRGMVTRSGRVLPRLFSLVGEVSGISGIDGDIEMSVLVPEGWDSRIVEDGWLDTGFAGTQAWDGGGGVDTGDIEFPGFVEIPLDDPFPEMEIIEDEDGVVVGGGDVATVHRTFTPLTVNRRGLQHHQVTHVRRPLPKPYQPVPLPPYLPGVILDHVVDPSLYWRWWRHRRRRRRAASRLPYR